VQLADTPDGQPSVNAGAKPMTGMSIATIGITKNTIRSRSELSQKAVYRCHKDGLSGKIPLPLARGVNHWVARRELTELIEGTWCPMRFAHGFEQQVLQRRVQILADEHAGADGQEVRVRTRMS